MESVSCFGVAGARASCLPREDPAPCGAARSQGLFSRQITTASWWLPARMAVPLAPLFSKANANYQTNSFIITLLVQTHMRETRALIVRGQFVSVGGGVGGLASLVCERLYSQTATRAIALGTGSNHLGRIVAGSALWITFTCGRLHQIVSVQQWAAKTKTTYGGDGSGEWRG